jgi:PAS domain S-box-containing protein
MNEGQHRLIPEPADEESSREKSADSREALSQRIRMLAENMPGLVCHLDPLGNIEYISTSVRFVLGYNAPELFGKSIYEFLHPEDRQRAEADFQRYSQTGAAEDLEYRVLHANGRYRWMGAKARPAYDREFELAGVLISAWDISELKQAREEAENLKRLAAEDLKNKTQELEAVIESLRSEIADRKKVDQEQAESWRRQEAVMKVMPVVLYSAQLRTPLAAVWMSDNVAYVTGYPLERFIKEPDFWMERVHPDDRETVEEYLEKVSAGAIEQTEYRWQCADGEYHWFLDQVVNVQLSSHNVTEYFGIWIDITSRKDIKRKVNPRQ